MCMHTKTQIHQKQSINRLIDDDDDDDERMNLEYYNGYYFKF